MPNAKRVFNLTAKTKSGKTTKTTISNRPRSNLLVTAPSWRFYGLAKRETTLPVPQASKIPVDHRLQSVLRQPLPGLCCEAKQARRPWHRQASRGGFWVQKMPLRAWNGPRKRRTQRGRPPLLCQKVLENPLGRILCRVWPAFARAPGLRDLLRSHAPRQHVAATLPALLPRWVHGYLEHNRPPADKVSYLQR